MATIKRIIIHPYKMTSKGAILVQEWLGELGINCLRVHTDGDYTPKEGDYILGWGAGYVPVWHDRALRVAVDYVNQPDPTNRSIDKLISFPKFENYGVRVPDFTREEETAKKWAKEGWVCCRTHVSGMDGDGLVLAKTPAQVVYSPLYTRFIPNSREFRIYVWDDTVVDTLIKVANDDCKSEFIRTEGNSYRYERFGSIGVDAKKQAVNAAKALGLTFAGVDIVQGDDGDYYVLETNTAPGIGQITARRIAAAMKESLGL